MVFLYMYEDDRPNLPSKKGSDVLRNNGKHNVRTVYVLLNSIFPSDSGDLDGEKVKD